MKVYAVDFWDFEDAFRGHAYFGTKREAQRSAAQYRNEQREERHTNAMRRMDGSGLTFQEAYDDRMGRCEVRVVELDPRKPGIVWLLNHEAGHPDNGYGVSR